MIAATKKQPDQRRSLISAIHAEKTRRGLDEDTYRSLLSQVMGRPAERASAKDCNIGQLRAVLASIRGQSARPSQTAESPYIRKARALWKSLYSLGAIDDPSDKALTAFARRQTGIDALRWITPEIAQKLIEPLRDMCRRAGYAPPSNVTAAKAADMLVASQMSILYPDGVPDTVRTWIADTHIYAVIAALGERIRQRR